MGTSPERLQRKTQHRSLVTRQKLLDAALAAFAESGFKGTSTRDIAARAGVHHPLITYHFSNKDRLWRSAVKQVFEKFLSALRTAESARSADSAKDRFAAMIRIYVTYAARYPALHKIVLQESSQQSARLEWLSSNYLNPLAEAAAAKVAELQAQKVVPAGDPLIIYNMIRVSSGTLIALALELKNTSNIDIHDPDVLDGLADLIVRIFLPGEACPA